MELNHMTNSSNDSVLLGKEMKFQDLVTTTDLDFDIWIQLSAKFCCYEQCLRVQLRNQPVRNYYYY